MAILILNILIAAVVMPNMENWMELYVGNAVSTDGSKINVGTYARVHILGIGLRRLYMSFNDVLEFSYGILPQLQT